MGDTVQISVRSVVKGLRVPLPLRAAKRRRLVDSELAKMNAADGHAAKRKRRVKP